MQGGTDDKTYTVIKLHHGPSLGITACTVLYNDDDSKHYSLNCP